MRGHIYALINTSLPGLIKVGKTTRDPDERAKELSSATGVPTPFAVAFSVTVSDCDAAEKYVHELLSIRGVRLSSNREFFQSSLNDIVKCLIECESRFQMEEDSPEEFDDEPPQAIDISESLVDEAISHINGSDDVFIDHHLAEEKLLSAVKLGSARAHIWLGRLYGDQGGSLFSPKKAISSVRKAIEEGYDPLECYAELAGIYFTQNDRANMSVAYLKYFSEPSASATFVSILRTINNYTNLMESRDQLQRAIDEGDVDVDEYQQLLDDSEADFKSAEGEFHVVYARMHCISMQVVLYLIRVRLGVVLPVKHVQVRAFLALYEMMEERIYEENPEVRDLAREGLEIVRNSLPDFQE